MKLAAVLALVAAGLVTGGFAYTSFFFAALPVALLASISALSDDAMAAHVKRARRYSAARHASAIASVARLSAMAKGRSTDVSSANPMRSRQRFAHEGREQDRSREPRRDRHWR